MSVDEPDWEKFRLHWMDPPGVVEDKTLGFMRAFIDWRRAVLAEGVVPVLTAAEAKAAAPKRRGRKRRVQ